MSAHAPATAAPASPSPEPEDVVRRRQAQQRCVAEFMDRHSDVFPRPHAWPDWRGLVADGAPVDHEDRPAIDKALGLLTGAFRSAQTALSGAMNLVDAWSLAREKGLAGFEPDPTALRLVQGHLVDEEARAYALAVTVRRECVRAGLLRGDELARCVERTLDELPGSSALMRGVIETAQRLAQIDLDCTLEAA